MQIKLNKPLIFIDLEATGLSIGSDRIVEISLLKVNIDNSTEIKTERVNPGIPIPEMVSKIHGIYDKDVLDAKTFKQLAPELLKFIGKADFAGFNSNKFDIPMLAEEFLRAEVDFDLEGRRLVDVQNIFHFMEPRNLSAAYKFYCNKNLENAHSAEADVDATWEVFEAQLKKYDRLGNTIESVLRCIGEEEIVDFARRIILENGKEVFNFGKHKGRKVEDVLKNEPSYYDWMIKSDFALHTKQKLTEIFNRTLLKQRN
jgi:DNA polymerase-3 subunit epsilon